MREELWWLCLLRKIQKAISWSGQLITNLVMCDRISPTRSTNRCLYWEDKNAIASKIMMHLIDPYLYNSITECVGMIRKPDSNTILYSGDCAQRNPDNLSYWTRSFGCYEASFSAWSWCQCKRCCEFLHFCAISIKKVSLGLHMRWYDSRLNDQILSKYIAKITN